MKEQPYKTFKTKKGNIVKIFTDYDPPNPRGNDNLGTMICFHRRYDLGDKHSYKDSSEFINFLNKLKGKVVWLPVYGLDHGGMRVATTDFNDKWDSGRLGTIYVTHKKLVKGYGKDWETNPIYGEDKIKEYLKNEVKEYDQYLSNDTYRFVLYEANFQTHLDTDELEEIDSCGGFFGDDWKNNGLLEHLGEELLEEI